MWIMMTRPGIYEYDLKTNGLKNGKWGGQCALYENKEVLQEDCKSYRTKEDKQKEGWMNPGNKDGAELERKKRSKALVNLKEKLFSWTNSSEYYENYAFMASQQLRIQTHRSHESDRDEIFVPVQTKGLGNTYFLLTSKKNTKENELSNQFYTIVKNLGVDRETRHGNNVQRQINKIKFSVPLAVQTRTGNNPVIYC
ncbi:hypothetical protein Tco_0092699 [Tanacetum coccineum]